MTNDVLRTFQREKEEALSKILQLEKQLDAKQKLEMEIEDLKGKLEVMKHLGDEDDAAVQKKMKEMNDELESKIDDLDEMESLNKTLIAKERQSNDELQEARRELIQVYDFVKMLHLFSIKSHRKCSDEKLYLFNVTCFFCNRACRI